MKAIDFLSAPGEAAGARPGRGGFTVDAPWGEYRLGEIELPEGWYHFHTDGAGVVATLYDHSRFNLIELQGRNGLPAFVRLSGGRYDLSVVPGARPGFHAMTYATLSRLSPWRRARLLAGRFVQALRQGVPPARIAALMRLALSRRTYGLRAAGAEAEVGLGVLSAADRARDLSDAAGGDYRRRLDAVASGPRFLVRGRDGEGLPAALLSAQVYRNHTLDPAAVHDFIVTVAPGETLTPDALLLLAEHIRRNPQTRVIAADAWIDGVPTARVAWDPLLYSDGPPTPFAHARHASSVATFANQAAFSLLAVPVASAARADEAADAVPEAPASRPPCSIIIPTRDRADLLAACLGGLFEHTAWPHEVIVVDNGSVEPETFALFETYAAKGLKVVRADMPFNFSILCNLGADAAAHDYLLFLNNDVVLHRSDWLERMMAFAVLPESGAVGARLLYGDGRLQHGGIVLGLTQICGHPWRGLPRAAQDREPRLRRSSLRCAVTAACLCVSRRKFEAVGGFDVERFPVTLNDVDLCLKLQAAGGFNIYCAAAEAYHLEGESRGADEDAVKVARRAKELFAFSNKWEVSDSWLPPSLSRAGEQCAPR